MAIELSEKIRFYGKEALEERLNVATVAERNAIPLGERYNGMIVTVRAEGKRYELLYDGNFEALSGSAKDDFLGDNESWKEAGNGSGSSETPESIATKYEGYEDVVRFTEARRDKLAGIATGATKNEDTDDLEEGLENKYFTEARAIGSKLAGYVKAETVEALTSSKTILEALSILEKALDGKVTLTPGGQLVVAAEKNRWNDTYTKAETENKIDEKLNNLVWRDAVENFADLATEYPDAIEGWAAIVNSENALYRYDGTTWINIGGFIIPKATASVDGLMSKEDFTKLRDIEAESTKNTNTDELDEGSTNKYFTEARAVAAKIAGYMKAETSVPLAETDSILQALGKLERGLDDRFLLAGDGYTIVVPGPSPQENGARLLAAYNAGKFKSPGGSSLSEKNRFNIIPLPAFYLIEDDLLFSNYVDILGFGPRESIVFNFQWPAIVAQPEGVDDVRLSNFTIANKMIDLRNEDLEGKSIYKDIAATFTQPFHSPPRTIRATFENIDSVYSNFGVFYYIGIFSGTLRNIPKGRNNGIIRLGSPVSGAKIENCDQILGVGVVENSLIKNSVIMESGYEDNPVVLRNSEFHHCTFLEKSANNNTYIDGNNVKIYYSQINEAILPYDENATEATYGWNSSNLANPIQLANKINGHNSWDEEGGSEGGLTPEQAAKLANAPANTNQELADINSDLLGIGQGIGDLEGEVDLLKKEYVVDIDFEDAEEFLFKAPEAMKITSIVSEPGTTPTLTGYTVGDNLAKYATFKIEVDNPGMVTLKGELL